jgi:RNA polymerase sigma factor (sigma-70 family)
VAKDQKGSLLYHLRRITLPEGESSLSDGQLLEDYLSHRDEAAVAALVRRHGPMVWGVCCRILSDNHDAEDAFQATFLVLVRKAMSVQPREMVGSWLYGVARQTALKARSLTVRRRAREKQVTPMPQPQARPEPDFWHDVTPWIDSELGRLPQKYRAVIVLCDLQGRSRKEAAHQLQIPEGTLSSRLTTARALLAKRLARHGLAVPGAVLAALVAQNGVSASVPASVVSSTIKAASLFAAGQASTTGVISGKVICLTQGVLTTMMLSKIRIAAGVLFAVAAVLGAGSAIYCTRAAEPGQARQQKGPNTSAEQKKQEEKARAKRRQEKFEDFAQFKFGGGGVSATGIRGKGGFTVVPLEAVAGGSKLCVSLAVKEEQQLSAEDFRVVAVDAAGKRYPPTAEPGVSAGGNGITVITVVTEFNLSMDKIDSLVIQRLKGKK